MKFFYLLLAIIAGCNNAALCANITAVQTGNWSSHSTWDLDRVPTNNDIVIIPSGRTVYLRNTPYPKNNLNARPALEIKVYGTFDFSDAGSDKLYLDVGSNIQVFLDGKIRTSNNSNEIIAIYNGTSDNNVWDGSPSTLSGPLYATSTSSGFLNGVLPLRFVSFEISRSQNNILLKWVTADEQNTAYFAIETKNSATNKWTEIGSVKAAGNSSLDLEYQHLTSAQGTGLNEFRLKQVDLDGRFTYSAIRSIHVNKTDTKNLTYNSNENLVYVNNMQGATLRVFRFSGVEVLSRKIYHDHEAVALNVGRGCYIVSALSMNSRPVVKKIIVR